MTFNQWQKLWRGHFYQLNYDVSKMYEEWSKIMAQVHYVWAQFFYKMCGFWNFEMCKGIDRKNRQNFRRRFQIIPVQIILDKFDVESRQPLKIGSYSVAKYKFAYNSVKFHTLFEQSVRIKNDLISLQFTLKSTIFNKSSNQIQQTVIQVTLKSGCNSTSHFFNLQIPPTSSKKFLKSFANCFPALKSFR